MSFALPGRPYPENPRAPRGATLTDTTDTTRISEVGTVFVPVADQERALAFYVGVLGFEKRVDFVYGAERIRWIEVAPAGASNSISLVPRDEGTVSRGDATYCALATSDIEADHAALRAAGAVVDAEIARTGGRRAGLIAVDRSVGDPVPAQCFFRDPDGNRFLLVEPG
jgi:catechol 2,3-dioxygenase-like lactoylglutathione lyase family enzyme